MGARTTLRATRAVLHDTRARVRGHDLTLVSAAASLYGALAVVPSLLVAVSLTGVVLGRDRTADYGGRLAGTLPSAMGAGRGADALVAAGLALTPVGVVLAVVMGTAYGEGLSRAFARFAPPRAGDRPSTWWVRATTLPLLGLAPLMLSGLLVASPTLASIDARVGPWGRLLAAYLSLTLVWVLLWLPLTWTYRVVGPGRPSWRAAVTGAVVAGAFVSGFLQGFIVFLAVPVDLGRPFGGLTGVGVASALLLWLWVLHAVVLVGYALTWAVDARLSDRGRLREPAVDGAPAGDDGQGDDGGDDEQAGERRPAARADGEAGDRRDGGERRGPAFERVRPGGRAGGDGEDDGAGPDRGPHRPR